MDLPIFIKKIREYILDFSNQEYRDQLIKHYKNFRFINRDWYWIKALEPYSKKLCNVSKQEIDHFISKIEEWVYSNFHLYSFLRDLEDVDIQNIDTESMKSEAIKILTFAFCLEMIVQTLDTHPHLIWEIKNHFQKHRKDNKNNLSLSSRLNLSSLLLNTKLVSVELPISYLSKYQQKKRISPFILKWLLVVNIIEAVLFDSTQRNWKNARTGLWLTRKLFWKNKFFLFNNAIGFLTVEKKTWVDVYHMWNMAFVSWYRRFPYFLSKLLIPIVLNYSQKPELYMYYRSLTLYLFCNYLSLLSERPFGDTSWASKKLTKKWWEYNKAIITKTP